MYTRVSLGFLYLSILSATTDFDVYADVRIVTRICFSFFFPSQSNAARSTYTFARAPPRKNVYGLLNTRK
jgi:hypothetical protein